MGHMLIEAVRDAGDCSLAGALDVAGSAAIGDDAGAFLGFDSGVRIASDLRAGLQGAQVLIDAGVSAIIQPGGSVRDDEVIDAARAAGVTMFFTGERHFFH